MSTLYTLHEECPVVRHRAAFWTAGFAFSCVCRLLWLLVPLVVVYNGGALWLKMAVAREPLSVRFTHDCLCVLHTDDWSASETGDKGQVILPRGGYQIWSTIPQLSDARVYPSTARAVPYVESREQDVDRDGRSERLHLVADFVIPPWQRMRSLEMLLGFSVSLHGAETERLTQDWLVMVSVDSRQGMTADDVSAVQVLSEMKLRQRHLLSDHRPSSASSYPGDVFADTRHKSDMNQGDPVPTLSSIIAQMFARNLTAEVETRFTHWTPTLSPIRRARRFRLDLTVNYPDRHVVHYRPGVWRVLQWAWLQYAAVLVVSSLVFGWLTRWLFSGHLFSTHVSVDRWCVRDHRMF